MAGSFVSTYQVTFRASSNEGVFLKIRLRRLCPRRDGVVAGGAGSAQPNSHDQVLPPGDGRRNLPKSRIYQLRVEEDEVLHRGSSRALMKPGPTKLRKQHAGGK